MIAKLAGILDGIESDHLILDVQGVGYRVFATSKTLAQVPSIGQKLSLWIDHIIRQDYQQLCGFYDQDERTCFQLLLTVQGVGVRVALGILSTLSPSELRTAITCQDRISITQAEGVGAKIAGRIVLELKDKIFNSSMGISSHAPVTNSFIHDALSGLLGLGYSKSEASLVLSKIIQENPDSPNTEVLIRLSLQKLAQKG